MYNVPYLSHISVEIMVIQEMKEIEQILQLKFNLRMTWVDARLDFYNIKLDETMKAITVDELHRIWLPIITLSWVTPEFGPSTLQWQNANSGVCQAGNPAQTSMRETNMRKFNRLIETFHKS